MHRAYHDSAADAAGKAEVGKEEIRRIYDPRLTVLDADAPSKVIGLCRQPLLAPEDAPYERDGGFRNNVIFPGGMILEESGEVKIYYGAADTYECLATADVGDLLKLLGR